MGEIVPESASHRSGSYNRQREELQMDLPLQAF